ncbi:MAG: hypothetical protein ACRD2H_04525 [Terriglobales bacterium]
MGFEAALPASTLKPIRIIDLTPLGPSLAMPAPRMMLFLGDRTLAVAAIASNTERPRFANRASPGPTSAYVLRVGIFDALTGRLLKIAGWPTNFPRSSGLLAADRSGIIAVLGDRIARFDPTLAARDEIRLPGISDVPWRAYVESGGREALFVQISRKSGQLWVRVDLERLRVIQILTPPPGSLLPESISEGFVAFVVCPHAPPGVPAPCSILVRSASTGRDQLHVPVAYSQAWPELLPAQGLYAPHPPGGFSIISVPTHRNLLSRDFMPGWVAGGPASALARYRIAIPVLRFGPETRWMQLYIIDGLSHVSTPWLTGAPVISWPPAVAHSGRWLALSADGMLLAALESQNYVSLFRLH